MLLYDPYLALWPELSALPFAERSFAVHSFSETETLMPFPCKLYCWLKDVALMPKESLARDCCTLQHPKNRNAFAGKALVYKIAAGV